MPRPYSGAPHLNLERARDHEGGSRTAWCADYWRGGRPGPGVVVEGVIEVK
jgi:hypothetical protein